MGWQRIQWWRWWSWRIRRWPRRIWWRRSTRLLLKHLSIFPLLLLFSKTIFGNVMLEALPVDNGWAAFIVLLLGDPHLLEGGEGRQDGATRHDSVSIEILPDVNIALHDGVVGGLMDT